MSHGALGQAESPKIPRQCGYTTLAKNSPVWSGWHRDAEIDSKGFCTRSGGAMGEGCVGSQWGRGIPRWRWGKDTPGSRWLEKGPFE